MQHQSIYNRLRRIEGTVRGIEEMVAKDRPESEIIIQLEAVKASLSSATVSLVEELLSSTDDGKVSLSPNQATSILRLLKK